MGAALDGSAAALGGSAAAFTGSGGVGFSATGAGVSTGTTGGGTGSTTSFFTGGGSGGVAGFTSGGGAGGVTGAGGVGTGCGSAIGDCFSTRTGGAGSGSFVGVGNVTAGIGVSAGGCGSTSDARSVDVGAVIVIAALVGGVVTGLRLGSVARVGLGASARAASDFGASVGEARAIRAFNSVVVAAVGARKPKLLPPNSTHINAACSASEIPTAHFSARFAAAAISWRMASTSVIA